MDSTLVDPLPATEPAGLSELVRQLGREVLQLRQDVNELRRENAELRQQVGYWKAMHARAVHRAELLQAQPPRLPGRASGRTARSRARAASRRESHAPRSTLRSKERTSVVPGPFQSSRRRRGSGIFHAAEAGPADGPARSDTAGLQPLARRRGPP